jgi:hypothetical protein
VRWRLLMVTTALLAAAACSPAPIEDPEPAPTPTSTAAAPTTAPVPRGAWTYESRESPDGPEQFARVTGTDAVLVFSQTPVGGRQARVELRGGQQTCDTPCEPEITVDGRVQPWRGSTPTSAQPQLALREPERLWALVLEGQSLTITYPGATGGDQTVTLDVTGADPAGLPDFRR